MVSLQLAPVAAGSGARRSYRVAGTELVVDRPLTELTPFAASPGSEGAGIAAAERSPAARSHAARTAAARRSSEAAGPVFAGPAWVGGGERPVECRWGEDGYRLAVQGVGRFTISPDGARVRAEDLVPGLPERLLSEVALGPALILALALQGTFFLHASALVSDAGAVALVGPSGCGKSTLAAALDGAGGGRLRRLADDVLPVAAGLEEGAVALPRFPQLKLSPGSQPSLAHPERLPLAAVFLLAAPERRERGRCGVESESLPASQAMLALVRHTVASRLFAPDLLARHLDLCAEAAARVPVRRLVYPRRMEALSRVAAAIEADLGAA